jgi:UDP-N-acetylmuramate: L-alanyl-gamma-D-glutamyl-meso-diaminopimelate ligase
MAGIALLARATGCTVSGCDTNIYPPMSNQLDDAGITLWEGYEPEQLEKFRPDMVIVGNVMSRGQPLIENLLDCNLIYTSGPEWLADYVLRNRHVLAVAGTHGKTTTSSLLTWILEDAGLEPGFLIGGIPKDFGYSARLGTTPFFVLEADEYDTAFFDKRSKFIHYRPRTLILNNLEFDHADIFPNLAAIQYQFHNLIRTVPGNGMIIVNGQDDNLAEVLSVGCWTPVELFGTGGDWDVRANTSDGSSFNIYYKGINQGCVEWTQLGLHNVKNALAAVAAANHIGVPTSVAMSALSSFRGVKRRLEKYGPINGVVVYDDFAHHHTAISMTLSGLRAHIGSQQQIIAVLEMRSNTMKLGLLKNSLAPALAEADTVVLYKAPDLCLDLNTVSEELGSRGLICDSLDETLAAIQIHAKLGTHVLIMSNGSFGGLHERLLSALHATEANT